MAHHRRHKAHAQQQGAVAVFINEQTGSVRLVEDEPTLRRLSMALQQNAAVRQPLSPDAQQQRAAMEIGRQRGYYDFYNPLLNASQRQGRTIREVKGLSAPLRDILTPPPDNRSQIVQRIKEYVRDFYLLRRWATDVANFCSSGFRATSVDEQVMTWCDALVRHAIWKKIDYQMHFQLAQYDTAVVWWKYYDPLQNRSPLAPEGTYVPEWVQVIDGPLLDFSSGDAALQAGKIQPLASIARKRPEYRTAAEKAELAKWPADLVKAAAENRNYPLALLPPTAFGYYVVHHWAKTDWEKFPVPILYTVLADIEYLLLCQDVDYSAGYSMKAGIMVWSIGPQAPTKDSPAPTRAMLKSLESSILKMYAEGKPSLTAGNDLNLRWFVPPDNLFSPEKYKSAHQRVMDAIGKPNIFHSVGWTGKEGSGTYAYSAGYLAIKPFDQDTLARRSFIQQAHERVLWVLAWMNGIGGEKPAPITVTYNRNILTEPGAVLNRTQFETQQGLISNQSAALALDLDPDYELAQRRRELEQMQEHPELYLPYYSPTRGGAAQPADSGGPNNKGAGRPEGEGVPSEPDNNPRPDS